MTVTASVAEYQELARAVFDAVEVPVLVGGSGLYVRAAIDELEFPGTDPQIRARLEEELAERGPAPSTSACASVTRPPRRPSWPATAGASCVRWR